MGGSIAEKTALLLLSPFLLLSVVGNVRARSITRGSPEGDMSLSRDAYVELEVGPSFATSQHFSHGVVREIVGSLQRLRHQLRCRAKLDAQGSQLGSASVVAILAFPQFVLRCAGA